MLNERSILKASSSGLTRREWFFAFAAAAAAGILCLAFANQRGFWLDEYFTLRAVQMTVPEMIADRIAAGHSPLYFFYARLGFLFGDSERAMRSGSALALAATVLLLSGLLGELKLKHCLPFLWILAVLQPYWIGIGTEFRYTMPLVALATGAAWAATRYSARGGPRGGLLLALAVGLLLWTHGSAPFFAAGLLLFLAWDGIPLARGRGVLAAARSALARTWPILLAFLFSLPFYYLVRNHPSGAEGEAATLREIFKELPAVVFGDYRLWFHFFNWRHASRFLNLQWLVIVSAIALTWLELRRRGQDSAWRLLACLLLAVPLLMFVFCLFVKNFLGPVRYMATFGIPAVICLAIAAHGCVIPRQLRWGYRLVLLAIVSLQFGAMALERGDRHREGIQWIVRNHRDREPILVSVKALNRLALKYHGLQALDAVRGGFDKADSQAQTEDKIRKAFGQSTRGFYIKYHSRTKILEALDDLTDKKYFVAQRRWKLGSTWIGIAIRTEAERPWLSAIKEPRKLWGPSHAE